MSDSHRRLTGVRYTDPIAVDNEHRRNEYFEQEIGGFIDSLPLGQSGTAREAASYSQPDGTTCFYASLGSVATALTGARHNISSIGGRARAQGLLGEFGAETMPNDYEAQTRLAHNEMGINIRFIDNNDQEKIAAVTNGLLFGKHAILGMPRHWVALDGVHKFGIDRESATWTGMDPLGGRRIEQKPPRQQIQPEVIIARLKTTELPLVVVDGLAQRTWPGQAAHRKLRRVNE
jgi:hypothetical protein